MMNVQACKLKESTSYTLHVTVLGHSPSAEELIFGFVDDIYVCEMNSVEF